MEDSNKIFLIGFMGSGKTTLGKKLANKLNKVFFDLDTEIEKRENGTIIEIFKKHGEDYFRKAESRILHEIISNNECFVMSLGGGTPCFYDNMNVVNQAGISVYLKYNAGMLTSRLLSSKFERPLIKNLDEVSLKEFVIEKLIERENDYNKSKIILEGNNLKVDDLINLFQ